MEKIVAMAMRFWREAECPDREDWELLFIALVEHDIRAIAKLMRDNNLEVE